MIHVHNPSWFWVSSPFPSLSLASKHPFISFLFCFCCYFCCMFAVNNVYIPFVELMHIHNTSQFLFLIPSSFLPSPPSIIWSSSLLRTVYLLTPLFFLSLYLFLLWVCYIRETMWLSEQHFRYRGTSFKDQQLSSY